MWFTARLAKSHNWTNRQYQYTGVDFGARTKNKAMSRLIPENPYTSAGWHGRQFRGREAAYVIQFSKAGLRISGGGSF